MEEYQNRVRLSECYSQICLPKQVGYLCDYRPMVRECNPLLVLSSICILCVYLLLRAMSSSVYNLVCHTCNIAYVGQTGRCLSARFNEHIRYIKSNNPKSAYAIHILNHRHEYDPIDTTMDLLKPCEKGKRLNKWEN